MATFHEERLFAYVHMLYFFSTFSRFSSFKCHCPVSLDVLLLNKTSCFFHFCLDILYFHEVCVIFMHHIGYSSTFATLFDTICINVCLIQ